MKKISRLFLTCTTLLSLSCFQDDSTSQATGPSSETRTISGIVKDSTGKVVPEALLQILLPSQNTSATALGKQQLRSLSSANPNVNVILSATTDSQGRYTLDSLPSENFNLQVLQKDLSLALLLLQVSDSLILSSPDLLLSSLKILSGEVHRRSSDPLCTTQEALRASMDDPCANLWENAQNCRDSCWEIEDFDESQKCVESCNSLEDQYWNCDDSLWDNNIDSWDPQKGNPDFDEETFCTDTPPINVLDDITVCLEGSTICVSVPQESTSYSLGVPQSAEALSYFSTKNGELLFESTLNMLSNSFDFDLLPIIFNELGR